MMSGWGRDGQWMREDLLQALCQHAGIAPVVFLAWPLCRSEPPILIDQNLRAGQVIRRTPENNRQGRP